MKDVQYMKHECEKKRAMLEKRPLHIIRQVFPVPFHDVVMNLKS